MQGITLLLSVVAIAGVFFLQPIYGLIVYLAALAWYPPYLTLPVGTIDFSLCRIIILIIFAKLFLQTDLPRRFSLIWLDKLVIICFAAQIVAGVIRTRPLMPFFENRAGEIFDTVLPYFAVRMVVTNKHQYLFMLKAITLIAAPLALVGLYECFTGDSVCMFMREYNAWKMPTADELGWKPSAGPELAARRGLFRASVTFPMSIMFGLFFAMFGPICAGLLRTEKQKRLLYSGGLVLMGLGVFSSMSSGPMLAAVVAILFLGFWRYRKYGKVAVAVVALGCGTVEIISNRHFYDVLGRFTLNRKTAWYRSKLIDVALFEGGMSGHWLTGYGYNVDPGWCARIDGRRHTSVVNHYLSVLCRYGLVGLIPFFAMNIEVIKRLLWAYKVSILDSDRWLVWCLSASLLGLAAAFVSVALFGQPSTIYYMMVAFAGLMPIIVTKKPKFTSISAESLEMG